MIQDCCSLVFSPGSHVTVQTEQSNLVYVHLYIYVCRHYLHKNGLCVTRLRSSPLITQMAALCATLYILKYRDLINCFKMAPIRDRTTKERHEMDKGRKGARNEDIKGIIPG